MRLGTFRQLGHLKYGSGRIVLVDYQTGAEKSIYLGPSANNVVFNELDEPEIGFISAENLGDAPLFIPSGWLINGLKQSRMVLMDSIVDVAETVMLSVVCCEKKRWGQEVSVSNFNRAPTNVLAHSRMPANDERQRQQNVWDSVAELEGRTHERETSSLPQIMQEEIRTNQKFHAIAEEIYGFGIANGANGYFFENEGELKAFEIFESVDLFAESGLGDITNLLIDVATKSSSSRSDVSFEDIVSRIDLRNSQIVEKDDLYKLVEINIENFATQALLDNQDRLVHLSGVKLPVLN